MGSQQVETGAGVQEGRAMALAGGGWEEGEIERMKAKVAEQRKKSRELEATVSNLQHELAQEAARRSKEVEALHAETKDANERYVALSSSLATCQKAHEQAQRYIKELETQRDERERDMGKLREAAKQREAQGGQAAASLVQELTLLKDKVALLHEQHESARVEAAKAAAQVERASEAAAAAEAELGRRASMHAAELAQARVDLKRAQDREAAAKREVHTHTRTHTLNTKDTKHTNSLSLPLSLTLTLFPSLSLSLSRARAYTHIGRRLQTAGRGRKGAGPRATRGGAAANEHGQEHCERPAGADA